MFAVAQIDVADQRERRAFDGDRIRAELDVLEPGEAGEAREPTGGLLLRLPGRRLGRRFGHGFRCDRTSNPE